MRFAAVQSAMALFLALLPLHPSAQPAALLQAAGGGDAPAAPATLSREAVRDLVSRLSDQEVRELLLQRLDATAADRTGPTAGGNPWEFAAELAAGVSANVGKAVAGLPGTLDALGRAFGTFHGTRNASGIAEFLLLTALAFLSGLAAAWLIERPAGRWRERIARAGGQVGLTDTLKVLGLRLLLDMSGLLAVTVVSLLIVGQLLDGDDRPFGRLIILLLLILPMATAALSRFLIAPHRPELRLVHTDDRSALLLHRHLIALALLIGLQAAVLTFSARNGVAPDETALGFWLGLATLAYIALIARHVRHGLTLMLRGRDDDLTAFEAKVAAAYPHMLMVLCGLAWLLVEILVVREQWDLITSGTHYLTLVLIAAAPVADTVIRGLVPHLVAPMTGTGRVAEEAYRASLRIHIRIGRVLVFAVFIFLMAAMWRIDFSNLATAGFGAKAAAGLIEALLVFGAGFLAFELVTLWINRRLADEPTAEPDPDEPGGGEGGGAGGSRLSTVLPLVRWVLQTAIAVVTALLVLGGIGLDVTPLLAGAGIAGLAIGFGAQKLVADVVSGIFFLIDDAFRTGEYLEIDGTFGTVERISLRSLRLRHHRGSIHTIPFGEIPRITNYSRDWVIMKLRFTVPFDTDLRKVKNIFKKIGNDMMAVPELADDMIQPFKSQGVLEVDDVGIVVRGKYMAKPGKQFQIRKEIYNRVQAEFEANGIQFARREVRVRLGGDEVADLGPGDRGRVAAAAAQAADRPVPPEAG